MSTVVVTVLCSVGVAASVAIIGHGRNSHAAPAVTLTDRTTTERVMEGVRVTSATLGAGFVGGLLGFGAGGRLMMRILAATSPDARGFQTDADEIVGEVSADGTIFLILFVSIFAAVAAGLYQLLRGWLPGRSLVAGLVAAGIGGGLLARPSALLDPDNRDFAILGPTWLAVLLCLAVIFLGALTIAVLVDRWTTTWPAPAPSPKGIAGMAPLVVCALPFAAAAAIGLIVVALTSDRRGRSTKPPAHPRRHVAGRSAALPAIGGAGLVWMTVTAVQILA